ncbi:hypothetical protein ACFL0Z_01130 [Patescibacteria group bacterium]
MLEQSGQLKRISSLLISTVIAVLSFFIFGVVSEVKAEVIEYSDYGTEPFTLSSDLDGRVWPVWKILGGAIMRGTLSFDVTGLKNETGIENPKRQLFAMYDNAQPTLWDNAGYFMQLRKRSFTPGQQPGSSALLQIKGNINCEWFGNEHIQVPAWNEDKVYHFTITWTSDVSNKSVTVKMEDRSESPDDAGNYPSWEGSAPLPWPFLAQQTEIAFGQGGVASYAAAFPSEPGATYDNIVLNAGWVADTYDDFGGYPPCEADPIEIDTTREDEPGTDLGDPYDDPKNPYDTCACISLDGSSQPPCEDDEAGDDEINLAETPFGLYVDIDWSDQEFDVGIEQNWTLEGVINEIIDIDESQRPEPALDIQFAPPAATTGEDVTVAAVAQNFRTLPRNMLFNWCLTRGDNGVTKSYNEVIASGGGPEAELATNNDWLNGGCCNIFTRNPATTGDTDIDNDGMGDNWERRYFVGQVINGVEVTSENALDLVLPNVDFDNDGYQASRFRNAKDEYITLTPGLQDMANPSTNYYPGADAKLTNVEEYILGTNPIDGDTDNDGYGDEMDYLGTGAMTFNFTIDMKPGPGSYGYLVTISAVGINQNNLVGIAARSRQYHVSEGAQMLFTLSSSPNYLAPAVETGEDSLTVEASVAAGDVKAEDLIFQWSFNGENICDSQTYSQFNQFCDVGRYRITIGPDSNTSLLDLPGFDGNIENVEFGTEYKITATAIDPNSRRMATSSISIPVVSSLDLTTACEEGQEDTDALPANGEEPISICVQQVVDEQYLDLSTTNFQWYRDGTIDQDRSGIGQSTYSLTPPTEGGESLKLSVQIIESNTGGTLGSGQREFTTRGPQIEIIAPPSSPMSTGVGNDIYMVAGLAGEEVNFVSEISNFPSTANFMYSWFVGSQSLSGADLSSYSFRIPADARPGTTYDAIVQVRGVTESGNVYDASDSLVLVVTESQGYIGKGNIINRGLAAVASLIPESFRMAVKIFAIVLAIGALIYFISRFAAPFSL